MSPDPSVLDEQVRETEKRRPRRPLWKKPIGCLSILLVAALFWGAIWTWRNRARVFGRGGELERLERRGRQFARTPPREMLEALRGEAAEIQKRWEELQTSGEIEKRLAALREHIAKRREEAGRAAADYWDDLIEQSDALVAKAREKQEKVPEELQRLLGAIGRLEEAVKRSETPPAKDAESENGSAETDRAPGATPRPAAASPDGLDYGMGK